MAQRKKTRVIKASAKTAKKKTASEQMGKPTRTTTVSRETLDGTPDRVFQLLRSICTNQAIMSRMMTYGFSKKDAREAWELLGAVTGVTADVVRSSDNATEARAAIAELDAADETLFRVLNATLRRHVPVFADKILNGLSAGQGDAVVLAVDQLLDRLDAAFQKPDADAKLAQSLLEQRGYGAGERARLRALVEKAQSVPEVAPPAARERAERELLEKLRALRVWYEEWSEIARVALVRRDYLIRAGLASRRSSAPDQPPSPSGPAPAP
jgi:hypothetical protein